MWNPPFCPNADCVHHTHHLKSRHFREKVGIWYQRKGYRTTACAGTYQRARCSSCGTWFCERTFHLDYRVQKPVSYKKLLADLRSRVSLRATQRNRGISPYIRVNRIGRLARNAIALHYACKPYLRKPENVIADGFVSFETSQYYPSNLHIAIGESSEYLYTMDHVTIRRTGKMSLRQKIRQAQLEGVYRPDHQLLTVSFQRIMQTIAQQAECWCAHHDQKNTLPSRITVITDNKLEYPVAIGQCESFHLLMRAQKLDWQHISSDHSRNPGGPMFAMDNFDRELRKDMAAHVRETGTFRRNVCNTMESTHVYGLYHNFFKEYRARDTSGQKRWQRAGLPPRLVKSRLKTLYTRRAFLSHVQGITEEDLRVWKRQLYTPGQLKQQLPWRYIVA